MTMMKLCVLAVVTVVFALYMKHQRQEFAAFVSLSLCLFILFYSVQKLHYIVEMLTGFSQILSEQSSYILLILKLIGIAYITEFASSLCKDSGFSAISSQVELAGKLTIIFMSIPIATAVLSAIQDFLG